MQVLDRLKQSQQIPISFELIPPKRGGDIDSLMSVVSELAHYKPLFIDITSHASTEELGKSRRKRPGTLGVCALIKERYKIDAVPHVLCDGFTKEETEDFLIELNYLKIDNVFALRGDHLGYEKVYPDGRSINLYASDLVSQITNMNKGIFLEEIADAKPTNFCIGVAGYPEKHFEAIDINTDILNLKRKVDAGASYIVTQMFFDNQVYFDFVDQCRNAGIDVPIIPGLKSIRNKAHIEKLPKYFHLNIPNELEQKVIAAGRGAVPDIGSSWTANQIEGLIAGGAPLIHLYVMQSANPVHEVMRKVYGQ